MESEEGLLIARGQGGSGRRAVAVALKRTEISGEMASGVRLAVSILAVIL